MGFGDATGKAEAKEKDRWSHRLGNYEPHFLSGGLGMIKERSNSIYSMHTIHMVFNNSSSIIVGMNSKKIEKEKLVEMR